MSETSAEPAERGLIDDGLHRRVDVGGETDRHDVVGELHAHVGGDQAGIDAIDANAVAELAGFHRGDRVMRSTADLVPE